MAVDARDMKTFINPANGYEEDIPNRLPLVLSVALFGGLYWAFKGVWGHALIWWVVTIVALGAGGGGLWLIALLALIAYYSTAAHAVLVHHYLKRGWHPKGFERE